VSSEEDRSTTQVDRFAWSEKGSDHVTRGSKE
jgi:hypothetical protein